MKKFHKAAAVINSRSGSTSDITDALKLKLSKISEDIGTVTYTEPDDIETVVDEALKDDCDVIVVYGGDGTICSVAMQATAKNVPIIALPGGTMNMFPKALYDTVDWEEAFDKAVSCDEPRWAAAGVINDEIFLCGCMIGTPTHLNEVREQLRDRNLLKAAEDFIFNAMDFDTQDEFTYALGRTSAVSRQANLLNVSCPLQSDPKTERGGFEVNAINVDNMSEIASLGLSALASDWKENQSTATNMSDQIHITATAPVDLLLDGEPKRFEAPFTIRLQRKGVRVLAP